MKKYLLLLFLGLLISLKLFSQPDSINTSEFNKYFQVSMGINLGTYFGTIGDYTSHGLGMDVVFSDAIKNHIYGFNMHFFTSKKVKEFTTEAGYVHYDNPALLAVGLQYGYIIGNKQQSHFNILCNLSWSWMYYSKEGDNLVTHNGFTPSIEVARKFKIGKVRYQEWQYTGVYTPLKFDPSFNQGFIEIAVGAKRLMLNSTEAKGKNVYLGLRYTRNQYSTSRHNTIRR